ncbi:hypothetical protein KJ840_02730 [Patescibacteria group bacterium]|nr:hypothetical protein [Patescibacteria group bacterium]
MSRIREYSRILILLIIVGVLAAGCANQQEAEKKPLNVSNLNMALEYQIALQKAVEIYQRAVADGVDLSAGPCLANDLHGNPDYSETMWVLDIAHYPREEVDDLPENQCSAYREGRARNFIEFNTEGQLIKFYSPLMNQ